MAWTSKITTRFLNMELPIPNVTRGPDWAIMINQALWKIDSHDHSGLGQGKQIKLSNIIVDGTLDLQSDGSSYAYGYGIDNSKYFNFANLQTSAGVPGVAGALFNWRGDLWWQYDTTGGTGTGTFVQLTSFNQPHCKTSNLEPIKVSTGGYTVTSIEKISAIFVDSQPTSITFDYVDYFGTGRFFLIQDHGGNASTNNIQLIPQSTDAFGTGTNGTAVTISTNYGYKWILADATNNKWIILAEA